MSAGKAGDRLFLIPTPIGNLEDITLRAVRVLGEVDAVIAEDTRTSGVLLKHLGISKPFIAFHIHNEHQITEHLVQRLQAGERFALVTDAGTPAISDPGFLLVRAAVKAGISVETLPGPTAFVPALVNSGLPCDRFTFEGFLPVKKGRRTRITELAAEPRTMVFYESPHRIARTLAELAEAFGAERPASISRELTKLHEETLRGTLAELSEHFRQHAPKGEFVLCVAGA
ncbi:MAG TPA: 16S rRNA (cytidine(1402)-2'-O)-methyltransferase [Flavobacteriales bacterium]|nr:16S rRNA (cytidine(1402)-2'-O)-methyltransferase [Flavobacteriales bacterium]HRO40448.1 16S rRNA (cytidine(1402)-2'-O)-methyltransferase [Flavobacteriales bacterium]HRQ85118.1 16S rRNA (cytidine(1402)-2'-O)-methyltransferase [Flavobacteriales bacterium]